MTQAKDSQTKSTLFDIPETQPTHPHNHGRGGKNRIEHNNHIDPTKHTTHNLNTEETRPHTHEHTHTHHTQKHLVQCDNILHS